ncbi:Crp/Fnr family transcriptional regulator [Aquimarina sp. AD10]|uniref:Crp/Fnr family transcriptional regulator n=1 Tax=Aquimarina aggregata TaxID=1642818 RepID=A0A162CPQ6_9FLAO|nr:MULTISPECIES: Crp/Fnr family transcriptional regulator [Aquimarina]AXT63354.1 Crp/Fnr family transcriptional regulator [Aquimarina sp. AD10]KZS40314.1 Crp/Fnr family transcriptional regulator [Aquimarina aggregata]RKN00633.1 Crp/Fnr family transcriptional regulator [Aquimarina sp. AD10]
MSKYKGILDNIARYVTLSDDEIKEFTSILKTTRIKKRQFVVQPGFISEYQNYIVEGAVRVFYLDDLGKEHTIIIGIEDWFFSDFYSYVHRTPAEYYAEALEDSLILQMKYEDVEELCNRIHPICQYFRLLIQKGFAYSHKRTISNISKTSEERYWEYVDKYPQIANRVPQYVLASYLGISPESISRIRSRS